MDRILEFAQTLVVGTPELAGFGDVTQRRSLRLIVLPMCRVGHVARACTWIPFAITASRSYYQNHGLHA